MENLKLREENNEKEKEPHFITSRLLKALGGVKTKTEAGLLVDKGAYLWGVEDRDKGKGILKHVLLTSRTAYTLARELQQKSPDKFGGIDLQLVVEAALLHDITKLYGEDREKLTPELKNALGLHPEFREIEPAVDEEGAKWLKQFGFPSEVYNAIVGHDFPEEIVDDPYWKIVLVADYMSGQKIMTVDERLNDVKTRWIDEMIAKGKQPRIEPERFMTAETNIKTVAAELFSYIGLSDGEFINQFQLNDNKSVKRWENFLTKTRETGREKRAQHLVEKFIK